MVNAPPTPPPVTSTEIQDAARGSTTRQATESSTSGSAPDYYQAGFPDIVEAVSRNDYARIISRAEEIDLNGIGDHQTTRMLVVAPLILAYLIQDDLPPARYTLERLPENLANLPLTKLLTTLTNATTSRAHTRVYGLAANLLDLVSQPAFFDKELALIVTNLSTAVVDSFRMRTFKLLSEAYSSLPLTLAQNYLGVSPEAIIAEANKAGWEYIPTNQVLKPKSAPPQEATRPFVSSLRTFAFVADSVERLEA